MQSARGTLLLKLCRDQRLQSNRIFLQTFIMPTPIMYYKSLPSHSASWSHQYSTACFSFPKNKLIYIGEKKIWEILLLRKETIWEMVWKDVCVLTHTAIQSPYRPAACYNIPSLLFLAIGVCVIHPSNALFITLLFSIFSLQPHQSTWTQNLIWRPLKLIGRFSTDFCGLLMRSLLLIPLTILPASPITYLFIPKVPYLLGTTTAFKVVKNSVPHCCFRSSFLLVFDESAPHGICSTSIYVFIINWNT